MAFEEIEEFKIEKKIKNPIEKPLFKLRLNKSNGIFSLVLLTSSDFVAKNNIQNEARLKVLMGTGEDHDKIIVSVSETGKIPLQVSRKRIRAGIDAIQGMAVLGTFVTIVKQKILATPVSSKLTEDGSHLITIPDIFLVTKREPVFEVPKPSDKVEMIGVGSKPIEEKKPTVVKSLEDLNRVVNAEKTTAIFTSPPKTNGNHSLPPLPRNPVSVKAREVPTPSAKVAKKTYEQDVLLWLKNRKYSGASMEFQAKVLTMSLGLSVTQLPGILDTLVEQNLIAGYDAKKNTNLISVELY